MDIRSRSWVRSTDSRTFWAVATLFGSGERAHLHPARSIEGRILRSGAVAQCEGVSSGFGTSVTWLSRRGTGGTVASGAAHFLRLAHWAPCGSCAFGERRSPVQHGPEILVDPEYRRMGVGTRLMRLV